jgi:hypothetical protein
MAVQNRIVKVQKRNRALVRYDEVRIGKAILRAATSIGGLSAGLPARASTTRLFTACNSDEKLATFLSDAVDRLPERRPASSHREFSPDD